MLTPEVLITIAGCSVVALFAIVAYTKRSNRKRRVVAFNEQANQMGLQILDDPDGQVLRQFDNFKLFSQGNKRQITNLIEADGQDVKILIFDYRFSTNPTGKGSTAHEQTVVALKSRLLRCPEILVRPKTLADKLDSASGFQPNSFDLNSEFSKLFVLNGPDEAAIRNFFTPAVLDFLKRHPKDSLEAKDDTLFFYRVRTLCKSTELEDLLAQARELFGVLTKANA